MLTPRSGAKLRGLYAVLFAFLSGVATTAASQPPNVILIVADDLGYGDIGANGATRVSTPAIDALARRGVNFTAFSASANVCTPSRAGLLTGRYPIRTGLAYKVVEANAEHGLPDAEKTLAEYLREAGYATGMVGKWHLGNRAPHWPTSQGFGFFFGVPHSNDMPDFALYLGDTRLPEDPVDQATLTARYTDHATRFIRDNAEGPFFLYVAHTFPHIPLHASEKFEGSSRAGLYGDVVQELDWSTAKLVATLGDLGLLDDTLVVFTSDNGAWWEGSPGGVRGAKGETWSGGYRVPALFHWPAGFDGARTVNAPAMNIDILPTVLDAAGLEPAPGIVTDGRSLLPLLRGETAESPHEFLYFFDGEDVIGVRAGHWKLLTHAWYRRNLGAMENFDQLPGFTQEYALLFDMREDDAERYSVARDHPGVLRRLEGALSEARRRFDPLRTQDPQPVYPPDTEAR